MWKRQLSSAVGPHRNHPRRPLISRDHCVLLLFVLRILQDLLLPKTI